jgi:hypothetical protein
MTAMRARYRKSDTGTARRAAAGTIEQAAPAAMPHHIVAVTSGPATIDAGMPASWIEPKVRARMGDTAACAESEAEAGPRRKGGRARPSRKEKRGPRTASPHTAA